MSLRWSSYVAPKSPKGLKNAKRPFPSKIGLHLNKACYKVSLCENCQRQSCRAFIVLTIHAKIIVGGRRLLPEILGQTDRIGAKSPFLLRCMECRHGLVMRILSVRLSFCLSVKRENWEKIEEKSIQIFIPYERSFSLVFWEKVVGGGDPFYMKVWVNGPMLELNRQFWTYNRL